MLLANCHQPDRPAFAALAGLYSPEQQRPEQRKQERQNMIKKQTPPHLVRVNTRKERNAAIKAHAASRTPAAVIFEDQKKETREIIPNAAARKVYDLTITTPAAVIIKKLGIAKS